MVAVAADPPPASPRRLGLTLGGGGFRGSAHIGVLYELERLGLAFDVVTGTSVGAIIGAGVAAGLPAAEIDRAFRALSPRGLLARDAEGWGLVGVAKLRRALESIFGDRRIEDLGAAFAALAVDLADGSQVALERGPLVDALLASAAMPGVFPPQRIGG
ncbi:MAG TPA: patatin-like phospholipase family protein, partial [Herpetosiphonaceae bacterium]